jgi:hypothetical protein
MSSGEGGQVRVRNGGPKLQKMIVIKLTLKINKVPTIKNTLGIIQKDQTIIISVVYNGNVFKP